MTTKKTIIRLARRIRRATGVDLPTSMKLAKIQSNGGSRWANGAWVSLRDVLADLGAVVVHRFGAWDTDDGDHVDGDVVMDLKGKKFGISNTSGGSFIDLAD